MWTAFLKKALNIVLGWVLSKLPSLLSQLWAWLKRPQEKKDREEKNQALRDKVDQAVEGGSDAELAQSVENALNRTKP